MPNPNGQMVDTSGSGGLGVRQYWARLFEENELAWREDPTSVLTDEQLVQRILEAFPARAWSRGLIAVTRWRTVYNRGDLPPGAGLPQLPSRRYKRTHDKVERYLPGAKSPESVKNP